MHLYLMPPNFRPNSTPLGALTPNPARTLHTRPKQRGSQPICNERHGSTTYATTQIPPSSRRFSGSSTMVQTSDS